MKRLTFKTEFVPHIQDGTKRFTSRWGKAKLKVGEVVAGVTRKEMNGKMRPAHLVPASECFDQLLIVSVVTKDWNSFTDEDAAKCGVNRAWYVARWTGEKEITTYEFKVVTP